jgi:hypothetical protein
MFFFRNKTKSAPTNGLALRSQASQQFPAKSQPSLSPQQTQQSQPLYPWSAHTPPLGQWPSPFPRRRHAISTTATAAGELFLFGGISNDCIRSDLYVISTHDFSTTLLQTSGDFPGPRCGHCAVLTSTSLLIWGGIQNQSDDDSVYLLNIGTRRF